MYFDVKSSISNIRVALIALFVLQCLHMGVCTLSSVERQVRTSASESIELPSRACQNHNHRLRSQEHQRTLCGVSQIDGRRIKRI
ncbi:hypothetical protein IW261DRAFT_632809 [Armillaria novae-zelandiae]|uniref:Uncharacterized protein n=1 Tax=Armillaria novae-zelandiae TaxID=153914 RepID=A0AA39PNQ6_9AGAR|nr:hypothetical protein IW261DRAFT_632809 [Armillaria novae-zelandiae]